MLNGLLRDQADAKGSGVPEDLGALPDRAEVAGGEVGRRRMAPVPPLKRGCRAK